MIVVTILSTLIVIHIVKSLYRYFTTTLNYWSYHGIKGPIPLPIFGNFLENFFTPMNVLEEKRLLKYGTIYGYFEFSQPMLTIGDPNLIREVAIKQFHNFSNRFNRNPADEFNQKGIFFMKDDLWKSVRGLISPVFTSSKVRRMFRHVEQCCGNTLQYIEEKVTNEKEVILKDVMSSYTMDAIAKCIFAVETNGYKDPNNEFLKKASDLVHLKMWRIFLTLLTPKKLQKPLNLQIVDCGIINYFKILVENIIEERKKQNVKRDDFIDMLLSYEQSDSSADLVDISNGHFVNQTHDDFELNKDALKTTNKNTKKSLEIEEIVANSILLLVAGYDTTSTLLNFTFYSLAMNPDVQQKLYEEVEEYCYEHEVIDNDSLQSLNYLDAVICEALRLYSPAVALDRVATTDCVLGENGLKIKKGTVISFPFYAMHRNPEYFPEPHAFKPERFLHENRHLIKPYTYLPFGVGPRNCIGMRFALMTAKLFLFKFVKNFKVERTENTPKKLKYSSSFITLSSEPISVKFLKRE